MDNKFEAMIITGRLEIQLQEQKKALEEIRDLQRCIANDNFRDSAIILGRLLELASEVNQNAIENINILSEFCMKEEEMLNESNPAFNIKIKDMGFSSRAFNCLDRAGIKTVASIVALAKEGRLEYVRNLGVRAYSEIAEKLKEYGIKLEEY